MSSMNIPINEESADLSTLYWTSKHNKKQYREKYIVGSSTCSAKQTKEEEQTTQRPKEEEQTTQRPKEEEQTTQWPKEEEQTTQRPQEEQTTQ
jgi:septum formation inhibitor MinC